MNANFETMCTENCDRCRYSRYIPGTEQQGCTLQSDAIHGSAMYADAEPIPNNAPVQGVDC